MAKNSIKKRARSSKRNAPPQKGGILAALRRSPLVGAKLDLTRPRVKGRKIDL